VARNINADKITQNSISRSLEQNAFLDTGTDVTRDDVPTSRNRAPDDVIAATPRIDGAHTVDAAEAVRIGGRAVPAGNDDISLYGVAVCDVDEDPFIAVARDQITGAGGVSADAITR